MRIQLALNVSNLEQSIEFYSSMFATPPAKVRPGYANFAIDNPPLKLVLFEGAGAAGSINHLGVETSTADEVTAAHERFQAAGLKVDDEVVDTECCYAAKTETWLTGPDQSRWEWYLKTGDTEQMVNRVVESAETTADAPSCCPSN